MVPLECARASMKRGEIKNTRLRPYIERSAKACVSHRSNYTDGQKKRTVEFCQVGHVVHKHELHQNLE